MASWVGKDTNNTTFNWLKDEHGLHSVSAGARIMLWQYASAWIGETRVDQGLTPIANDLLRCLITVRKSENVCLSQVSVEYPTLTIQSGEAASNCFHWP